MVYFHGAAPGIYRGGLILPPATTRAPTLADYGAGDVCRRDRVYITTDQDGAAFYALMHHSRRGWLYEVEPLGTLEPDADWSGTEGGSVCSPSARVVAVVERNVKRWHGLDQHGALRAIRTLDGDLPIASERFLRLCG